MGILDFAEKAAGALAADKALEAVDPNAGMIEKAAAAVAGFEGVAAVKDHFNKPDETAENTVAPEEATPDASQ